ncbi:MAG TPA: hypothetical protein VN253_23245 [Kofleriaceae bacterium]|nr:hypothetical protein [Kofleriaceae bacterium]
MASGRSALGRGATLALLAAVLAAGCKDRPKTQPVQPTAGPGSAPGAGSGSGAGAARAAGSGEDAPKQNELDIPKLAGTPPIKTTTPLARAQYEKMAALEYPGWKRDVRRLTDKGVEVRYKTQARPILAVTLTATPCFDCIPLELPRWKAKTDALKNLLAPELRDRKDTIFEVGEVRLAGAPLIFTYQLGYLAGVDDEGQQRSAFSDAYALYHHDGVNQIRVVAQYMDDQTATRDDMANLAPRDDLAQIALAFLDTYTHAW